MKFLDTASIRSNMRLATACLLGHVPSNDALHSDFIRAVNVAQGTTIKARSDGVCLEFDNPELVSYLTRKDVFSPDETKDGQHLLPTPERSAVEANIRAAMRLIAEVSPNLHRTLSQLIGSIAVYKIPYRDGGTVSCCIGLIWLSPGEDWTIEYYAEMIVHEFVHNSVFLDDMVNGIMPNPEHVTLPEAHAISVLRKTKRPYDKAFHSACVAIGLMYFYHRLGATEKALSYVDDIRRTAEELHQVEGRCRAAGVELLSDNGRDILASLRSFGEHQDYELIRERLAA